MARHRPKRKRALWIQGAIAGHKGALHRQLGIPVGEKIPLSVLLEAAKAPGKLGHRARLALTLRKMSRKRKMKHKRSGR